MVVAIANQKGGCGKTTTTLTTAHLLHLEGEPVAVLDLDAPSKHRKAGASAAYRRAKALGIPAFTMASLPNELPKHVMIDCPPDVGDADFQEALDLADLVIVPSQPTIDDLEVTQAFAKQLGTPYGILLTRVHHTKTEAASIQAWLKDDGYSVFQASINDYRAFKDAAARESTVADKRTLKDQAACRDYLELLHELRSMTHGK